MASKTLIKIDRLKKNGEILVRWNSRYDILDGKIILRLTKYCSGICTNVNLKKTYFGMLQFTAQNKKTLYTALWALLVCVVATPRKYNKDNGQEYFLKSYFIFDRKFANAVL